MKVSISVPGIFHAFKLAEGLEDRDCLERLYTSIPMFKAKGRGVSKEYLSSISHPEFLYQGCSRLPIIKQQPVHEWKNQLFDRAVSKQISESECDVFIGFAGASQRSLTEAQKLGVVTGVERSSTHIRFQRDILQEEYQYRGRGNVPITDSYLEQEESEYDMANYIIVPSEFVKRTFLDQGVPEDKIICEPFGVPIPDLEQDHADGTFRFLFLGLSSLRKGTPYLLEAWESLDLDAELAIAGRVDDEVKPMVDAAAEDDESINVLGWVEDIQEWFTKSNALVFPTLEEGSAMVTYQAMAAGLPVITTLNSGWVGSDREHGIEVQSRDADSLATAMTELYESRDKCRRMGERARALIESDYTVQDYHNRIISQYEEMLRDESMK